MRISFAYHSIAAIVCYDKALEIAFLAWLGKGECFHGLRKYDKAIEYYDKSLEIEPNNITIGTE
jgi:tetratricopeptide (TPR) repeat protein